MTERIKCFLLGVVVTILLLGTYYLTDKLNHVDSNIQRLDTRLERFLSNFAQPDYTDLSDAPKKERK